MPASKPLHVNVVSIYFHPDLSGTGQILTDLAIGLTQMGCDVTVYTAQPTFGTRQRMKDSEVYEGVRIRRVFGTQLDKDNPLGRIINSVSFFVSAFWALLTTRTRGPLLIVSHPPFLAFAGYVLRKLKGQRYVYLVHDVFPDAAIALGYISPNGLVSKIWDAVNGLSVRHAARVIVLGESMKGIMLRKGGPFTDPNRFHVIHNWADEDFIKPLAKSENWFARQHGLENKFVVLYSGNIGRSHDLETVIAAAERLRDREMVFLFIGDGGKRRKLEVLAEERGLRNVRFLPYQPREALPFSLTSADVSLVALEKGIEGLSMPSKLYSILAVGRPIIALVERDFEVARIIESAGCGRSVAPTDVEELVSALDFYYANRDACARDGRRGREYFETHFARSRAIRDYRDVLQSV